MRATARDTDAADQIAQLLVAGFDENYRLFRQISAQAKKRFEAADWAAVAKAVKERIQLEDEQVDRTADELRAAIREYPLDAAGWRRAKLALRRAARRPQAARARRDILQLGLDACARPDLRPQRPDVPACGALHRVHPRGPADLPQLLPARRLRRDASLGSCATSGGAAPLPTSSATASGSCARSSPSCRQPRPSLHLCVLSSAFYRNKARVRGREGRERQPRAAVRDRGRP